MFYHCKPSCLLFFLINEFLSVVAHFMEVGITYKGRGVKNEVDEFSNETYREEKKTSINGTLNIFKNRTGKNLHLEGIFNCFFSSIYIKNK